MSRYGFSGEKHDTKFLILFVLRDIPGSVTMDTLAEMTLIDDNANYFVFADALAEMTETGHIERDESGRYALTPKGAETADIVENELPISLRRAAAKSASVVRRRMIRESCVRAQTVLGQDGAYVQCALSDGGKSPLLELRLYAGSAEQAEQLVKAFRSSGERIYASTLEAFLKDGM